jgi:hypothetical protein
MSACFSATVENFVVLGEVSLVGCLALRAGFGIEEASSPFFERGINCNLPSRYLAFFFPVMGSWEELWWLCSGSS